MVSRFLRHDIDLDCKVFASLVHILYSTLNASVFAYIFLYINHVKVAATAPVALLTSSTDCRPRGSPTLMAMGVTLWMLGGSNNLAWGYLPLHPLNKVGDSNSPGESLS